MKRYITLAVTAVLCWSAASAQQEGLPSRSMTIEGAYTPTMTGTDKILPVPDRKASDHQPAAVSYLTDANPIRQLDRAPMGVFSENSDQITTVPYSGLVRFGYGLRNIHDGLLDFDWHMSQRDELRVSGLMDAWASKPDGSWKSRMFNADLTALYQHRFDSFSLNVDAALGHSHYNYRRGVSMDSAKYELSSLMQKVFRAQLGVSLDGKYNDIEWYFNTGMQWYSRKGLELAGSVNPNKERLLRIGGGARMPFMGGTGGVDYRQKTAMYDWQGMYGCGYPGFTTLTLSPYWEQTWNGLETHLGVNLDIRTAAGYKVLLSPMATASYRVNGQFMLTAAATGGVRDNDMRTLSDVSPYWSETERIKDGYTLADLSLGASYSYDTWLTLSAKGGYRHTIDDLFQTVSDSLVISSCLVQQKSDIFYARLDAGMLFADRAEVRMDITCNGYTGKYKAGTLAYKPALDASLYGKVNIMPGLDAMLTYRLMTFCKVNGSRMAAVNDLALTVDYDYRPNLSFYMTANRLVGGDWYYYAGYRALKPAILLGATYRF